MTARSKNHDWLALTVEDALEPEPADLRPAPPPVGHSTRRVTAALSDRRDPGGRRRRPQRRVHRVHRVRGDVQARRPGGATARGRDRVRERDRRDERLGPLRQDPHRRRDRRHRRPPPRRRAWATCSTRRSPPAAAASAAFAWARPGIRRPAVPNTAPTPAPGLFLRDDFRAGFAAARAAPAHVRGVVLPPPDPRRDRAGPRVSRHHDHPQPLRRAARHRVLRGPGPEVYAEWRKSIGELATCPNVVAKLGGINMEINGFGWHERPRPPSSQELWTRRGTTTTSPSSSSAPTAACSSRTSRSTWRAAATRCCGTRSSA